MHSSGLVDKSRQSFDFIKQKIKSCLHLPLNNIHDLAGLDINPGYMKLLKIIETKNGLMVENCSLVETPAKAIVNEEIKDYGALVSAINDLIAQSNLATKNIAIAIPRSIAIIKTITIDKRLNPDEVESRAWIEARNHFPDIIDNIYLDFVIMGPAAQDASQVELMLVACRKEQINPYLDVIKQCGLQLKIIDIDCYALERALPLVLTTSTLETIALLNLNVNLSSFIVVHQNHLIHAHDQSYDGQHLVNQTLEFTKNLESSQIQNLIGNEAYLNILKGNLISHLRHLIHFFYSSRSNISIQKIILTGDCANIPDLFLFIQNELGIQTEIGDPFLNMTFSPSININEAKKLAPKFMLCSGLALIKDQQAKMAG